VQQAVTAQLLRLRMEGTPPQPKLWRPSRRLCAVLNDLREVHCNSLRASQSLNPILNINTRPGYNISNPK
jgi:hypothetical protein